jgi:AAA family ATPase
MGENGLSLFLSFLYPFSFIFLDLGCAELLAVGLLIENVERKGRKRAFCVQRIVNAAGKAQNFGRFVDDSTRVEIVPAAAAAAAAVGETAAAGASESAASVPPALPPPPITLPEDSMRGLKPQVQAINSVLAAFSTATQPLPWLVRSGGILLHGPSGTGKSVLLKRIAALGGWGAPPFWLDAATLSAETGAPKLRALFAAAAAAAHGAHRISVVLIDNLETIAFKRGRYDSAPSLATALQAELDALATDNANDDANEANDANDAHRAAAAVQAPANVLVVAATNALNDIDNRLRRPSCFAFEIEIPIPNSAARTEIIKSIVGVPSGGDGAAVAAAADPLLEDFGQRTHGYTRSDVYAVVHMAGWIAVQQQHQKAASSDNGGGDKTAATATAAAATSTTASGSSITTTQDGQDDEHSRGTSPGHGLTRESIDRALVRVRPSAIRELILEVPKVRWSDIGGQEHVKQVLRETLESQLKVRVFYHILKHTPPPLPPPNTHTRTRFAWGPKRKTNQKKGKGGKK